MQSAPQTRNTTGGEVVTMPLNETYSSGGITYTIVSATAQPDD